jgi:hypothetical protein
LPLLERRTRSREIDTRAVLVRFQISDLRISELQIANGTGGKLQTGNCRFQIAAMHFRYPLH